MRSACTLYACAAACSVVCMPRYFPLHLTFHFLSFLFQLTPVNCEVLASRCFTGSMPSSRYLLHARAASSSVA